MPKLTENLYVQNPGESLLDILDAGIQGSPSMADKGRRRLAHIINTYRVPPASREAQIHQATYATMKTARDFTGDKHDVEFVSVHFPEDRDGIPDFFYRAEDLQRSVLDLNTFTIPRKLPLVFDILHHGIEAIQDAEYVVFTNTDINLMPYFYDCIINILNYGFDVIVVNRREIPGYSTEPDLMAIMYSDYGVIHAGFDCFVFPVDLFRKFISNQACVGAGLVMRGLLFNLVVHARKMLMLRDCHLTFHLGQDRAWRDPALKDYTEYNRLNASNVLRELSTDPEKSRLLKIFLGDKS